jgi:hypothetical protein
LILEKIDDSGASHFDGECGIREPNIFLRHDKNQNDMHRRLLDLQGKWFPNIRQKGDGRKGLKTSLNSSGASGTSKIADWQPYMKAKTPDFVDNGVLMVFFSMDFITELKKPLYFSKTEAYLGRL